MASVSSGRMVRRSTTSQRMPSLAERVGGLQRHEHHLAAGDDGAVVALTLELGHAERDHELLVRHLALDVVEHLALDEDHRVVVADGALEQALGVGRRAGRHHLEPRDVGVPRLERLRVLRASCSAAPPGPAEHHRHRELAARHVEHLGGRVDDLVHRQQREVPGHELDDRAQAHHRRADAHAGEAQLGDRRVDHARSPNSCSRPRTPCRRPGRRRPPRPSGRRGRRGCISSRRAWFSASR
jgi:hypothetical protein